MLKKLYLLITLVLFSSYGMAQKMHIKGQVIDTTVQKPLHQALAMVVRIKDSVLIDFKRTDINGNFEFTMEMDTVQLVVSHPKFSENAYYLFGHKENLEFNIRNIVLPPKSLQLKEVVIYAYKDPVFYKGDTLVYIADSFATRPNAVVEDLLKKLPGIKVNADGSIQAQGKDIQQVLVDGDEFFGADPTMATRNLGAKGVDQVQIYEKKNENSTDDTETIQVLDLKLKDDAKKGYFGKASFGSDAQQYYEGEFLANRFNKKQKMSVFALASNTMKSSLAWRDMYKYGLSTWEGRGDDDDNFRWNFSNDQGDGVPRTFKTGVYFDDQISKNTKLGINYTYSNGGLVTTQSNRSQYFLSDTSYVSDQTNLDDSDNESHELNIKLTQKLDSLTTLEIEPKLAINHSESQQEQLTNFYSEDNQLTRYTSVRNRNTADGTNLNTRLSLTRNFKKKGRKFTSTYRLTYDENASEGYLLVDDSLLNTTLYNLPDQDQQKLNKSKALTHNFNVSYIEPLSSRFKIDLDYEWYANNNDQQKYTYEYLNGRYDSLVSSLSNDFESTKNQHRVGSQLIYEYKKHRLSAGARVRNVKIENYNLIKDTTIFQDVTNILPRARYVYKLSQHNRFVLNYSTSSSQPSINQLQPVNDNSNPNRIVYGNPDLKPNFVHSFSGSYNFYKPLSGTHMWTSLNHSTTQNGFANETTFDNFGRTTSKTVNVDGNMSASFNVGGGFPLFKKFMEVFPNVNTSYNKSISFINGEKNITINRNIGAGMEIRIERDSFEFRIGGNYDYTSPSSTISTQVNLPYASQNFTGSFEWRLPARFFLKSDAEYTMNTRRANGYNINFFIWNASVARSFLKNENLLIGVEVYDILKQNLSADRFVSGNIITDTRSNIITRYFLARLTYKFNSTKTKEADDFF